MVSVCPSCGRCGDVYVRFGGAFVCRACFVTEVLLGSWLGLEPDLSSLVSSSVPPWLGPAPSSVAVEVWKGVMGCGSVGWSV